MLKPNSCLYCRWRHKHVLGPNYDLCNAPEIYKALGQERNHTFEFCDLTRSTLALNGRLNCPCFLSITAKDTPIYEPTWGERIWNWLIRFRVGAVGR